MRPDKKIGAKTDELITLEFLARKQQRLFDKIGSMRDPIQVLTTMAMRLEGTVGLALTELRAMDTQYRPRDAAAPMYVQYMIFPRRWPSRRVR